MMKKVMILMAFSAIATSAFSHEGMHGPGSEYDKDESGALSVEEYARYLRQTKQDESKAAAQFAALDANKDGKLSSAEFAKGLAAKSK